MVLALIGIVYGALVAMVQPNMKKLIAYLVDQPPWDLSCSVFSASRKPD